MKTVLFFLIITFSINLFAGSEEDQFNAQIEAIMKAREEMLKSLMDDSMMGQGAFEKRMQDMMKAFGDEDFGMGIPQMEGAVVGEYDWEETANDRTLKIKVKQIKDHPLDIKIEKGMVKFKGDVESVEGAGKNKRVRKVAFERSFSLPQDVDQTNPEFLNKEGEILIKFKKKVAGKAPQAPDKKEKTSEKPTGERVPVTPGSADLNI